MNFFDRHKKYFLLLLVLGCLVLAGLTTNRLAPTVFEKTFGIVITPLQKGITAAGDFISARVTAVTNTNALIDENTALKQSVEELKLDNSRIALLEQENAELTELLSLKEKYKAYPTTGARIIAKDPGNWYDVFIVDKGSKDGVEQNMVVIADGGLVGRIKECGYSSSKVVSIIDDADAVSSMSMRTGDVGYVKGDLTNKGMCKMELIDSASKITEDDEIITSPFSSVYPEGITIGKVKSISPAADTATKTAVIEPAADFKHLKSVLIITERLTSKSYDFETETTEVTVTEEQN